MRILDRKLSRDLRQIRTQALAIALVLACGIMVLVLSSGTQRSLETARQHYYEQHRFADVFATLTRAPQDLLLRLARVDGVARVEGRIVFPALLDLDGKAEPASAIVLSIPASGEPILNVPLVRKGRLPDPDRLEEVAVSEAFAEANALRLGDAIRATVNGQLRSLLVTGVVISPEYIYTVAPGSMEPDDDNFGILWLAEKAIASAANLEGAFNTVSMTLALGADERSVIAEVDTLLEPYGGTGAFGRERQASNVFIEGELQQLGAMAAVLPPIFLIVSAVLVNMVLGRLVALERSQIGLLKALGYGNRTIALHYVKMTIGIGIVGVVLGWLAGAWLGRELTDLYTQYFRFPELRYSSGAAQMAISGLLGLMTVVLGGLRSVRVATKLAPAVAMAPAAPPSYRRGWLDQMGRRAGLRQTTMMVLRSVIRWPGRAAVTVFGVAGSVAVLIASFFTFDAVDLMMDELFDKVNRQDASISLSRTVSERATLDALSLPGVFAAEGVYAAPVRLTASRTTLLVSLQVRDNTAQLSRLLDQQGQSITLPPFGVVVSDGMAARLGLRAGERLQVELLTGARQSWELPVTAIIRQSLGQDVYMDRDAFFRLVGRNPEVNLIHLSIDQAKVAELQALIKKTPMIARFTLWSDLRAQFEEMIGESLVTMTIIFAALGMLITFGVVYNAARIQLAERSYELASLRVLGFRRGEVGYVLIMEQMLLTVLALPIGWAAGYGFCAMMAEGFSTEIVSIPVVVTRRTFAIASMIVVVTGLFSTLVVRRRLDRIDIVSAMKQKE